MPPLDPKSPPAPADPAKPATPAAVKSAATPPPARKAPTFSLAAILAFLVAAILALWWLAGRDVEVTVARLARGSAAEVVYATGIVEPKTWAKVTAPSRRRITELCDCEGKTVKQGEILARLDDGEERAQLTELEARLAYLREDVQRLRRLVERNITSRKEFDEKLTQIREFEARIVAQKHRIEELQLRSPMDGVVLRRDGEVGEIAGVGAGDVLLWIGQPQPLQIVAEVNEDDVFRVKTGQRVLLRHEGHEGVPLTAAVDRITPKGTPETKTFRVFLSLPDDTPLLIGMSIEANIVVREAENAVLVPTEAVSAGKAQVVENGRLRQRDVVLGARGGRVSEVISGLEPGDIVLVPRRDDLDTGTRVRMREVANR
ncbi:MAG: efflux RND transporter periplasmic adaptor subunit [Rhizobiales bacterium]|nr:efflux RND transporter periplasmic adaptor subunit [Hyphomicrobiales bacterium]